jgi:hypothetical protein
MNTNIVALFTVSFLALLPACDTDEQGLPLAEDFRNDPLAFWQTVICLDAGECWALHPDTADAWVRVLSWEELGHFVEMGRLKPNAVAAGFGPLSCAPGKVPDSVAVQQCYQIGNSFDSVCYGGGSEFAAEIMPNCDLPFGYSLDQYLAVGCIWDLGEHTDTVELFGHATQIEAGLLVQGNGAMSIAPGCHFMDP